MRQSPQDIGHVLYVPERRRDLPRLVQAAVTAYQEGLREALEAFLRCPDPEGFLALEERVLATFGHMAAQVVAGAVCYLQRARHWVRHAVNRTRERMGVRSRQRGWRSTQVVFLGGLRLALRTPYVSPDLRGRPGPRRGVGRRGDNGTGRYPVLEMLGIHQRVTPAVASEVTRAAVRTASFEEAQQALCERGIDLDEKTVRRIALAVGRAALAQRQVRLRLAAAGMTFTQEFAGKRIVLSTDGGRLRLREGGQRGRRGPRGRRKYDTPWREPKVVMAYAIDEHGQRDEGLPVLYDATMGDADAAFEILVAELRLRGAAKAQLIVVTADGARWIWSRIDDLARALGLAPEQIVKVADYYHAVEHLGYVADLCPRWSQTQRRHWVGRMKQHLLEGQVDLVVAEVQGLCRGRNARKIAVEARYFAERRDLMRYDEYARRGIPRGSGAVESAIRRVVNLRLKGASTFWRKENAEAMLHLRCYLKAGRWDELMARVFHRLPDAAMDMAA